MLSDPREIEIIANAKQKNVRDPKRSRAHFVHIFEDFFSGIDFEGQLLVDMGPGQYDFGMMARERGANTIGLDQDPAVLELGRYKSFEVREYKLQKIDASDFDKTFDGVFCKFSWNAFWFHTDDAHHRRSIEAIGAMMTDAGWGWIAPWNGVPKTLDAGSGKVAEVLSRQISLFESIGFEGYDLGTRLSRHYGVHGTIANNALFVRNVDVPLTLRSRRLSP